MRWWSFLILAYLVIGVQLGAGRALAINGAVPQFVLLVAVFVAINAPRDTALLACFVLGGLQDLFCASPMGLYAFCFGMVGLVVSSLGSDVYHDHPLTHFFLALVAGTLTAIVVVFHGWYESSPHGSAGPTFWLQMGGVLYTSLLAPLVIGLLQRTRRAFGFHSARSFAMAFNSRFGRPGRH